MSPDDCLPDSWTETLSTLTLSTSLVSFILFSGSTTNFIRIGGPGDGLKPGTFSPGIQTAPGE